MTDKAHKVEVKVVKSAGGKATLAVSLNGEPTPAQAESGSGAEPQTEHTEPAASGDEDGPKGGAQVGAKDDGANLAATGGDSSTTLPLAAGGAALFALGGAFLIKSRRRKAVSAASARHAR